MNTRIKDNNTSGVTGVFLNQRLQKWTAQIVVNQKHIYLGVFIDKKDAIIARKRAEENYYKEYSCGNSRGENNE